MAELPRVSRLRHVFATADDLFIVVLTYMSYTDDHVSSIFDAYTLATY